MDAGIFLGVALVLSAPALKDRGPVSELSGEWEAVDYIVGARRQAEGSRVEFGPGSRVKLVHPDGGEVEGAFKVDSKTVPARIDVTFTDASVRPMVGIYIVAREYLILCFGDPDRPTAFESGRGSKVALLVLKRPKKD